jgi:hypothetical protein
MALILPLSHDRRATLCFTFRPLLFALVAAIWVGAAAASERWYRLELDGQPAGHLHEVSTSDGAGTQTRAQMALSLDRDGQHLDLQMQTLEREQGATLLAAQLDSQMAGDATQVSVEVLKDHLMVTTTTSAGRYTRQLPMNSAPAGPEYIRVESLARLQHAGDQIHYTEVLEDTGDLVQVTRTLIGERVPTRPFRIEDYLERENRRVSTQLDGEGYLIESVEDSPLGRLVTRRSDHPIDPDERVGARIPVAGTLTVSPPVSNPREVRHWTVQLLPVDEPLHPSDFTGPGQAADTRPPNGLALEIALAGHDAASRIPPTEADLKPNALFPSDAPEMTAWAQELLAPSDSEDDHIRAIVAGVHHRLSFDAGFAVANALDVLRRGRGTCVAYATLTAALLRTTGLPSRIVYGYVYAEGALVGHAWTEVWTHGHWRAVDAALYANDGMDAARIALARSDGAAGLSGGLEQLARTFGRFTVSGNRVDAGAR